MGLGRNHRVPRWQSRHQGLCEIFIKGVRKWCGGDKQDQYCPAAPHQAIPKLQKMRHECRARRIWTIRSFVHQLLL